jgi:hypothetical protein
MTEIRISSIKLHNSRAIISGAHDYITFNSDPEGRVCITNMGKRTLYIKEEKI